jgi:hypothetical protein
MSSVVEQAPYNEYISDGVATVYPYEFQLLSAGDLVVTADGVAIPSSDFTLSGVGSQQGGDVTFSTPPASGSIVLLSRDIALERDTDYQYNGDLKESTVDSDFNRLWQALQGVGARLGGALRLPYPEQADELPSASGRKGFLLGFDDVTGAVKLVTAAAGSAIALALQLALSGGSALVGFIQAGVGAVIRTVQAKLRETVSIKDFGAVGDGVTDDTAAFLAARTYLQSVGGGSLYIPRGQYLVNGVVLFNFDAIFIYGDGARASVILTASGTADIFVIGDGITTRNAVSVTGIGFNASVTRTAGHYLKLNKVNQAKVSKFWMGGPFVGLSILDSTIVVAKDAQIVNPTVATGVGLLIDGTTGNDHYLRDIIVTGNAGSQPLAGIRVRHTAGLWMSGCGAIWSGDGLLIDPAGGQSVLNIFTSRNAWDTCLRNGCSVVPAAGGAVRRWSSHGDWFSTNTLDGFVTGGAGSVSGVSFLGPMAYNNGRHGLSFTSVINGFSITDPRISGNSTSVANIYDGINVAAGVSNWNIKGGKSGQQDGFTNIQRYGLAVEAGASDNYSIRDIDVTSNTTGGILDGGSGTTKYVQGNPGARTSNSGGATIAVAASSIAVNHGLAFTPTVNDIQLTPLSNLGGSGISFYWVSAATSTTFTISVNTNVATIGINFAWTARIKGA